MDQCNRVFDYKTIKDVQTAISKQKKKVEGLRDTFKGSHLALITCNELNPSKCLFKGKLSVMDADYCNELIVNPC